MLNVFLIVEGQTEEKFYKTIFAENFPSHNIKVVIMPNKRGRLSKGKGGRVSYDVCVANAKRFINENTNSNLIIVVYDYYGLDVTFKSHLDFQNMLLDLQISSIKQRVENNVNFWRFKFILQVHEFESYLFSNVGEIAKHFSQPTSEVLLQKILLEFNGNPESINNSKDTAPSKRLEKLFPKFGKMTDGLSIIRKIGVDTIRKECKYFNEFCLLIESTESKFKL